MSSSEEISIPPPALPPPPSASSSSHNGVGLLGGLNSHHPHHHHHHQHILFQEETNSTTNPTLPYNCPPPPNHHHHRRHPLPDPKTRPLSSLLDHNPTPTPSSDRHPHHRFFPQGSDFTRSIFGDDHCPQPPDPTDDWNNDDNNNDSASSADDDDSNDDDPVEEDDDDDDDDDAHPILPLHNHNKKSCNENDNSKCTTEAAAVSNANGNGRNPKHQLLPPFGGSAGEVMVEKDGRFGHSAPTLHAATTTPTTTTTTTTTTDSDGDMYYAHYLHSTEGPPPPPPPPHHPHPHPHPQAHGGENGCSFSGRKDLSSSFSTDYSRDSLRSILSDPVTGELMDDAMILPCGHSFGGAGMQHVLRNKACYNCSRAISEESFAPNLSLRAAVLAFHREEELQCHRSSKRRKERFCQDKGDSTVIDPSRGKGVQFPFAVTDRVIIKGNKRTPQRFVGREAVVTTQCLNGWYVVKTLDNAESVKLQYRSLARVSDETSSKAMQSKMGQQWL